MILALTAIALVFSGFPCWLYFRNVKLFRAPTAASSTSLERISVLIPARNEESGIAAAIESILANEGVELEVIVLDDASSDRTSEIVRLFAANDVRVQLATAPPLPEGWCGKQHACFQLSLLAKYDVLTFLDADVRLGPVALKRMTGFLRSSGASLVSGFPRQETVTFAEKWIVPLIHWVLLCYLPLNLMRNSLRPGLGAGCGQWFMTTAEEYRCVGGHGHPLVRASLHDGVKLPRTYRMCGFKTDICDAGQDAVCRMYRSSGQVWNGFAKNAQEGLGAPGLIWIWTLLFALGHILPFALLSFVHPHSPYVSLAILAAVACSLAARVDAALRFEQPWIGVFFHPLAVAMLLAIQWYATARSCLGRPVGWKGRTPPCG